MTPNPILGVFFHWLGGLAAASFYIPYRGVKRWAWETYWLVGGFFSWIIAPWLFALLLVPGVPEILRSAPFGSLLWAYAFGALWGVGGLTFGLTMRYLGIALGMAIALGYCAAFGTLMPPIFNGEIGAIARSTSGQVILLGVLVCLVGIFVSGLAGISKVRELTEEQKRKAVREFSFWKGLFMATFSGIMSSCFAYGLAAGKPIADLSRNALLANWRSDLWQNLPVLVVVLLGGFTTNFIWCVFLNVRNRTGHQYLNAKETPVAEVSATEAVSQWDAEEMGSTPSGREEKGEASIVSNYVFSAIAGTTWYLQFFFYGMGQTKMGAYEFSSWTLHMASIIIFSTLWGIALREWRGTSRRTHLWIGLGLSLLVLSTMVVGYGNFLKAPQSETATEQTAR
jgi:L-rhamnose-H+ transport protein